MLPHVNICLIAINFYAVVICCHYYAFARIPLCRGLKSGEFVLTWCWGQWAFPCVFCKTKGASAFCPPWPFLSIPFSNADCVGDWACHVMLPDPPPPTPAGGPLHNLLKWPGNCSMGRLERKLIFVQPRNTIHNAHPAVSELVGSDRVSQPYPWTENHHQELWVVGN